MAINTYQTYLMHGSGTPEAPGTYTKLIDIVTDPDTGGAPEELETTTMSDAEQTFIKGIRQKGGSMEFTTNYDVKDYGRLKQIELEGTINPYAIYYGGTPTGVPDGHDGIQSWSGELSISVSGGGVNAVRMMTISISSATAMIFSDPGVTPAMTKTSKI